MPRPFSLFLILSPYLQQESVSESYAIRAQIDVHCPVMAAGSWSKHLRVHSGTDELSLYYYVHRESSEPKECMFQGKCDRLQLVFRVSRSKPQHQNKLQNFGSIHSTDWQSGSLDASHDLTHLRLRKDCSLLGNDELFFEFISCHGAQFAPFGLYHPQHVEFFQSST